MTQKIHLIGLILFLAMSPLAMASAPASLAGTPHLTPLQDQVRHALVTLPYFGVFDNLQFQVVGSKAILSGQVVRPTLKREAESAVKRVAGIQSVENNIEVLPFSPFDNRIRLATYWAIYSNPIFTRYAIRAVPPIHIVVKNGFVTLVGVVATRAEKNIARIDANSVPNVFKVDDELRVA